MKKVLFETFGCKVNLYETQLIREGVRRAGFEETEDMSEADICVVNTCCVTETGAGKSLAAVRRLLRQNRQGEIVVTGCLVMTEPERIRRLHPARLRVEEKEELFKRFNCAEWIEDFGERTRAFVKIQDGCDNNCSYCIVPFARGRSRSRPSREVIEETRRLSGNGYKEIVLTGICLGEYGKDLAEETGLSKLISQIENIEGIQRIRLSSIEPKYITEELIRLFANNSKLCAHLHIPFQSGSDYILQRMNRLDTLDGYRKLVERLRSRKRNISISADIITGFPGESEENFLETYRFIEYLKPSGLHIFPFSPRKGTAACGFDSAVPRAVVKKRADSLKRLGKLLAFEYKRTFIGSSAEVLIEGKRDKQSRLTGYTDRYLRVCCDGGNELKNRIVKVFIEKAEGEVLVGSFLPAED